ncbi:MAG TPA: PhoU domain-containing protein [Longimicrobiales bacterium]|nr:PhoU domain-containing protein [Longimicrobiales bacterium]
MVLKFFKAQDSERLERIEAKIQQMLEYDRKEFDLAMSALLGDATAAGVNDELRSTDRRVNELEREIRRELLVHASVFGGIDTPAVLVYMSIVKDIERIGDYAKNLVDLALDGSNFGGLPDSEEWRRLQADISRYIADCGRAFRTRDPDTSRKLLSHGDGLLDVFDDGVSALVSGSDTNPQAVARALAHRYLKRVVAHLMNVLSSVVMPLDKLDYFDEDPEDRARH